MRRLEGCVAPAGESGYLRLSRGTSLGRAVLLALLLLFALSAIPGPPAFAQSGSDLDTLSGFIRAWRQAHTGGAWDPLQDLFPDGKADHLDAEAAVCQLLGGVWVGVTVEDAATQQPIMGATVQLGAAVATTDATGVAGVSGKRGACLAAVSASGYDPWSGPLTMVSGAKPVLYLVPSGLTVTVDNHQAMMQGAYSIALILQTILTEWHTATPPPAPALPPTDDDLRAACKLDCEMQAVGVLSGVADNILGQVEALPAEPGTVQTAQARPQGFFSALFGMNSAANSLQDKKQKALSGQDVPEVDAYLSTHPYAGYTSLAAIRADLGTDGVAAFWPTYVFAARSQNGVDQIMSSGASIVVSGYGLAGPGDLVGQNVADTWGVGIGYIVSKVVNYSWGSLLQYVFGVGRASAAGRLVLGATKPDGVTTMAWPSGTWDMTESGGSYPYPARASVTVAYDVITVLVHPGDSTATSLLIEAEHDLADNNLATAAAELVIVIAAQPAWSRPHGVLGVVRQLQGQTAQATAEYAAFALNWRTAQGKSTSPESDRDARFIVLLNAARMDNSLPPLKPDARLAVAAVCHSDYMLTNAVVQHEEPDRPGYVLPWDRMKLALGWDPNCWMAENVAAMWGTASCRDQSAVDYLHDGLMNSPGHYANIMSVNEDDIGIAVSLGAMSMYVTQDFAQLPLGGVGPGIGPAEAKVMGRSLSGPLTLVAPPE